MRLLEGLSVGQLSDYRSRCATHDGAEQWQRVTLTAPANPNGRQITYMVLSNWPQLGRPDVHTQQLEGSLSAGKSPRKAWNYWFRRRQDFVCNYNTVTCQGEIEIQQNPAYLRDLWSRFVARGRMLGVLR